MVRSYLDWLTGIPWKKRSKVKSDLGAATEILNEDHFEYLEKVFPSQFFLVF